MGLIAGPANGPARSFGPAKAHAFSGAALRLPIRLPPPEVLLIPQSSNALAVAESVLPAMMLPVVVPNLIWTPPTAPLAGVTAVAWLFVTVTLVRFTTVELFPGKGPLVPKMPPTTPT